MQSCLIRKSSSKRLYVVFLGWGMDENPILPLIKDENVLMLFNCKDLSVDFDFSGYDEFYEIAFSYGVMEAALLQDKLPPMKQRVAINGTLCMRDQQRGLPDEARQAIKSLSLDNYLDFRKKWLVANQDEYDKFNAHAPLRTIEDCMEELYFLETLEKQAIPELHFHKVYISRQDKLIPMAHQLAAWKGQNIQMIDGNHFALYGFTQVADMFDEA